MTSAILGTQESMSAFLTVQPHREGISMGPVPFQTLGLILWRHTGSITARGRLHIDTGNRERRVFQTWGNAPPPRLLPIRVRLPLRRSLLVHTPAWCRLLPARHVSPRLTLQL